MVEGEGMRCWNIIEKLAECYVSDQMGQESVLTQGQAFQLKGEEHS